MIFNIKYISKLLLYGSVTIPLSIGIGGCNETLEPDYSRFGYDFFPLEIGQYQVYNVTDISFSSLLPADTSYYELKVVVTDSLIDNAGESSYILQRLKRTSSLDSWQLDSVWTAYKNDVIATVFENNIPVIKLVFPFREGQSWDANSLNARNNDDYQMIDIFKPYSTGLDEYLNSITIIQEEKLDSIISLDYRYEIYGQNVGLVEKVSSKLDFCQESDCRGQKIIDEGRIYKQVLTVYGTE